jgi:Tol biopolymer transport system component
LTLSPSSFSPDGSELALSRTGHGKPAAVAMHLADRQMSVIAHGAESPVYSPDGQWIALLAYRSKNVGGRDGFFLATDLYVKSAHRPGLRQLTRTANRWESSPSWDPSGDRVAYTQGTSDELLPFGFTNVVMAINRDGTCANKVFDRARPNGSSALYGPAWQPGVGREAGRIAC